MTEDEWLACADPTPMLEFLQGKASDRKLRLFAVACCRRIWHMLSDERSRTAVEVAEKHAEGKATAKEMDQALSPALLHAHHQHQGGSGRDAAYAAAWSSVLFPAQCVSAAQFAVGALALDANSADNDEGLRAERSIQGTLVHCVFGNPFRPSRSPPATVLAWNDGTVRRIAEGIYEERRLPEGTLDNGRLAILSDALLDAGCDNEDLIVHCRSPGPHVRGCWAIDLILGKE
jgi:hypothetical protein